MREVVRCSNNSALLYAEVWWGGGNRSKVTLGLQTKRFKVEAIGNSVILILIDAGLRPRRDNYVFSKSFACKQ